MSMKIKRKERTNSQGGFGFRPITKPTTEEDINAGLRRAFSDANKQRQENVSFGKKPQFNRPLEKKPKLTFEIPEPEPEPEEEEPYWSAEQWERWAYDMYVQYPDTRKFLPKWFIEAVENE